MRAHITKRLVDTLHPTGTDFYVFDTALVGFGMRVRATGSMSYIVQYKSGSGRGAPTRRVTLGAVGKMAPDPARTAAKRVLGAVAHGGHDPAADKAGERAALTVGELIDAFTTQHVDLKLKPKTRRAHKSALSQLREAHGGMRAAALTRRHVSTLHASGSNLTFKS